jgi:hypothetical protein
MFRKQILFKGLYKAPEDLEVKILLQAAEKLNLSEEADDSWLNYLNLIPCLGFFILLRDLIKGNKFTISPAIEV